MNKQDIGYALAKQVPAMQRGFTIATSYGDITIEAGWMADCMADHMRRALQCELLDLQSTRQDGHDRHGFSLEANVIGGSYVPRPTSETTAAVCCAHCGAPQLSQADSLPPAATLPTLGSRQ